MADDATRAQDLALWLGSHPILVYLVGLVLVLAVITASAVLIRHVATWIAAPARGEGGEGDAGDGHGPGPASRQTPRFTFRLVGGLGVLVVGGALFAAMLDAFDAGGALGVFDSRLAATLAQQTPPAVLSVFGLVTHLGDPRTLTAIVTVVAALLLARRQWTLALSLVIVTAGSGVLNRVLKELFARARPLHEHGFAVADGFSFPSGHSSGAVVVYGMLAYLAGRLLPRRTWLPVTLITAGLAYTMGVSRVVLQVHWASDVIAGFASGSVWLVACIVGIESLRDWRRRAD